MSPNAPPQTNESRRVAARGDDSPADRRAMESRLASTGVTEISWFKAKDDDELNQLALNGEFRTIHYLRLDQLLTAIWKGDVNWNDWIRDGIHVEVADASDDWRKLVGEVHASYRGWSAANRRRQIIACLLLSTAALVAAAILLHASPIKS